MIDYLMNNLWLLWIILAVVCLIIEVSSFDFFVTCFAIGAVGAMIGALIGLPWWVQVLIWAVVSVLSIWFVRPSLTRRLHKTGEERVSNADALIGKEGLVIEAIPEGGHGYVKVDGDEWRSLSSDGSAIAKGTRVRIVSRDSIVMTVEPV